MMRPTTGRTAARAGGGDLPGPRQAGAGEREKNGFSDP